MSNGSRPGPLLNISVERLNGFARMSVAGELDMVGKARFEEYLQVAEAVGPTAIFLDVENLVFMDSTPLPALITTALRARKAGGGLQIRGARPGVRRLLTICGLHWLMDGSAPAASESTDSLLWEPVPLGEGVPSG